MRTDDGARWSFTSHSMTLLDFLMDAVLLCEGKSDGFGSVFCQLSLLPKIGRGIFISVENVDLESAKAWWRRMLENRRVV